MSCFLVQRIGYIEDHYIIRCVEHLFSTRELAEKWIEKEKLRETRLREARSRANAIDKEWASANPFVFAEERPPHAPRWRAGLREDEITAEMRAEREAANKLENEWCAREMTAMNAYYDRCVSTVLLFGRLRDRAALIYLIALKWRSAINVSSMRTFTSYEDLKAHFGGVYDPKWYGWHVYEIFPDKEPRHLSAKENRDLGIDPPREEK